jgi:phenylalanyl-tRNA synthetase alpha chain
MTEEIKNLKNKLSSIKINDEKELENFRLEYLSKKGLISSLFSKLKEAN